MKFAAFLFLFVVHLVFAADVITPTHRIELFNGKDFSGFTFWMKDNAGPLKTWSAAKSLIYCNGSAVGFSLVPVRFNEQDVRQFVISGRTIAEITNRFGRPSAVMTNSGRISMWFINPLMASSKAANPFGFATSFPNGMVEKWEALQRKFDTTK